MEIDKKRIIENALSIILILGVFYGYSIISYILKRSDRNHKIERNSNRNLTLKDICDIDNPEFCKDLDEILFTVNELEAGNLYKENKQNFHMNASFHRLSAKSKHLIALIFLRKNSPRYELIKKSHELAEQLENQETK